MIPILKTRRKNKQKNTEDAGTEEDAVVISDELEEVVFLIAADGTVEKRVVTTGIQDINFLEITGGLKEGEQIVTGPYTAVSKTLKTGSKAKVVSQDQLFEK